MTRANAPRRPRLWSSVSTHSGPGADSTSPRLPPHTPSSPLRIAPRPYRFRLPCSAAYSSCFSGPPGSLPGFATRSRSKRRNNARRPFPQHSRRTTLQQAATKPPHPQPLFLHPQWPCPPHHQQLRPSPQPPKRRRLSAPLRPQPALRHRRRPLRQSRRPAERLHHPQGQPTRRPPAQHRRRQPHPCPSPPLRRPRSPQGGLQGRSRGAR